MRTITYADGSVGHLDDEGRLHRLDGPAYVDADGAGEWWVGGARIPRDEQPLLEHLVALGYRAEVAAALATWTAADRVATLLDAVPLTPPEPAPSAPLDRPGRFTWRPDAMHARE